jgi:predicted HicB family RNase H-like nuclease
MTPTKKPPAKKPTSVRLMVLLPADLHDQAKKLAAEEERSLAALIRFAVRRYVKEQAGS